MSAEGATYLDSSAIVKLVVSEAESDALIEYLRARPTRVSCGLARVEVVRAARPNGVRAVRRAREVLERISVIQLDEALLGDAAEIASATLRSLDAIHLAAARQLGADLRAVATYDRRMADAARALDLAVVAPG